jgi:hypothetical protein
MGILPAAAAARIFGDAAAGFGNVGIWVLNVILAGFTFEPVGTFPPVVRSTSIGVMQGVKTPQKRHRVLTAIYRVDQKVEQ